MPTELSRDILDRLRTLPDRGFVREWNSLVGGPPAVMLDRELMIQILQDDFKGVERPPPWMNRRRRDRRRTDPS